MHNLGGNRTAAFDKYEAWEFMKEVKRLGLVRYIGFSAHCTPEELEQFIRAYPEADLVQLQINYFDWENPSFRERECVEIAVKHGLPIVAMEPVKGGLLANPSQAAKEVIDRYFPNDSYSTAALRFTASVPGVKVTLSGMNSIERIYRYVHEQGVIVIHHSDELVNIAVNLLGRETLNTLRAMGPEARRPHIELLHAHGFTKAEIVRITGLGTTVVNKALSG